MYNLFLSYSINMSLNPLHTSNERNHKKTPGSVTVKQVYSLKSKKVITNKCGVICFHYNLSFTEMVRNYIMLKFSL